MGYQDSRAYVRRTARTRAVGLGHCPPSGPVCPFPAGAGRSSPGFHFPHWSQHWARPTGRGRSWWPAGSSYANIPTGSTLACGNQPRPLRTQRLGGWGRHTHPSPGVWGQPWAARAGMQRAQLPGCRSCASPCASWEDQRVFMSRRPPGGLGPPTLHCTRPPPCSPNFWLGSVCARPCVFGHKLTHSSRKHMPTSTPESPGAWHWGHSPCPPGGSPAADCAQSPGAAGAHLPAPHWDTVWLY